MATLGAVTDLITASQVKLYIGTTPDLFRFLQVLDVNLGAPEFREPTTNGGSQYYYGDDDASINFTLLGTGTEMSYFIAKRERSNGLASSSTWQIVYTSNDGSTATMTVMGTLVPNFQITKPEEGGVKYTGTLRLTANVTSASVA